MKNRKSMRNISCVNPIEFGFAHFFALETRGRSPKVSERIKNETFGERP